MALILIGVVGESPEPGEVVIEPEAYLKGAAERKAFTLTYPEPASTVEEAGLRECPPATLTPGARVLLALSQQDDALTWPDSFHAFVLVGGMAANPRSGASLMAEEELVNQIRSITGQYVVPAEGEGTFSIQGSNIAIMIVGLLAVFVVGLALMRVWHRIDPT